MKDNLEGVRPSEMDGVNLHKHDGHPGKVDGRSWKHIAGWLLAAVFLAIGLINFGKASTNHSKVKAVAMAAEDGDDVPNRSYTSSRMENVVVAGFTPSHRGKHSYRAKIRLIGKGGLEITARPPMSCPEAPIEARLGRIIKVRADTWTLHAGGTETTLSDTDADAALCGSFAGRDVARRPSDAVTQKLNGIR